MVRPEAVSVDLENKSLEDNRNFEDNAEGTISSNMQASQKEFV